MRFKEIPHGLELAKPADGYERSPGLHASTLYGAYYAALEPAKYDKRLADGTPTPFDLVKLELGLSFEQEIEEQLAFTLENMRRRTAARVFGHRPGEFMSPEGIAFSPDYLFDLEGELVLGELKFTFYSSKGFPTDKKFGIYLTQMKMYCHWLGITNARILPSFINGNYAPP